MLDVIVIGAGQAGLSRGYYLQKVGYDFVILDEEKRIGDSWRNRYDSSVLFTPKSYSSLPGMQLEGDGNTFPTKDEIADYLETYAVHFSLPVQLETLINCKGRLFSVDYISS
nr:NAD(P)-binding domain-containing protein [Bacillus pseudomycoides]